MAQYFFDTSALVKRYRAEQGTDVVDRLFADAGSTFVISRLGIVETVSALALKVRAGELSLDDYAVSRKKFLGEIGRTNFSIVRLLVAHCRNAERLIDRYSPSQRFRTLDALQLSTASDLRQQGRIDTFVCADEPLCEVASQEGLAVLNPLALP
ncbi:MAG: type II toxin-antitoxin system VapC family toxin [Planctomycetes bacterium]|nr:type II toxin-antitoxin system VapC family toxin [Planctomycetota bacterium]